MATEFPEAGSFVESVVGASCQHPVQVPASGQPTGAGFAMALRIQLALDRQAGGLRWTQYGYPQWTGERPQLAGNKEKDRVLTRRYNLI